MRVKSVLRLKKLIHYSMVRLIHHALKIYDYTYGFVGFDRTVYSNFKKGRRKWRWYEELKEQRGRDIETEML